MGHLTIPNRVFLAPMSGVSDRTFRSIAQDAGAGLVVSEMVASELLARGDAESTTRSERTGKGLHVVQLAGREAHWMAEGAKAAEAAGADIIDINMGCPAKKVTSGYSGSALMRDLDHALTLIEATVGATSRPVTLKMRLGWDEQTINAPELAWRAVEAGVCLITVHGRTRCQFYAGKADWDAVAAVRAEVKVPLIVNGDIGSLAEAEAALAASGADGVMIGRGAYGQPWRPGDLALEAATGVRPVHSAGTIMERAIAHYRAIIEDHGAQLGVRVARKHLGWYLDRAAAAGAVVVPNMRAALMVEPDPDQVVARLAGIGPSPEAERLAA